MVQILFDEHGKPHGVYKNAKKAHDDNLTFLRGRGFLSGEVPEDQYSEKPL